MCRVPVRCQDQHLHFGDACTNFGHDQSTYIFHSANMIAVLSNHIYSTYVYRMSGWEFIHVHAQYLHQRFSRVALSASTFCFSSVFSLSRLFSSLSSHSPPPSSLSSPSPFSPPPSPLPLPPHPLPPHLSPSLLGPHYQLKGV